MGSAIDTVIVFRVLRLLTYKWTDQAAYKEGLIDAKGKRININGTKIRNLLISRKKIPNIFMREKISRTISYNSMI